MTSNLEVTVPQELTKELRQALANAISDFKSYEVPGVCVRIGLDDGTAEEAHASKFRYAMNRIASVQLKRIISASRLFLSEEKNFRLSEALHKIDECAYDQISEITRRRIVSTLENAPICTEIEEMDFLRRVWPIEEMPSVYYPDSRKLSDDIYQHTVNNYDWETKELLEKIGIFTCSQAQFFKFLAAVTDPLVQTTERQTYLVEKIDLLLSRDNFKLAKVRMVSGCPYYEVKPAPKGSPADDAISIALKTFDPTDVHARWIAAMESRESNPPRAITLARTLLEDVCKWIIAQAGGKWNEKDDLPVLYRKLASFLKLAPDEHTEATFKQILGSCQNIVESLGSLRNKLSDAHSIGPIRARPSPRHAELAVNLSGTMATFLVSTWQARQAEAQDQKTVPSK